MALILMIGYPESEYNLADGVRKGAILYADADSEATTQFSANNIQELRAKKAYRLYTIKFTGEIPKPTTPRLGLFLRKRKIYICCSMCFFTNLSISTIFLRAFSSVASKDLLTLYSLPTNTTKNQNCPIV